MITSSCSSTPITSHATHTAGVFTRTFFFLTTVCILFSIPQVHAHSFFSGAQHTERLLCEVYARSSHSLLRSLPPRRNLAPGPRPNGDPPPPKATRKPRQIKVILYESS